jgi:hypothetical protein
VKLFGRDMTKEDAVRFLLGDQHEHLGPSIAYGALQRCRTAMVEARRESDILGNRAGDYSNTAVRFPLFAVS